MTSLKQKLVDSRQKTAHGQWFVPETELDKIVVEATVKTQLLQKDIRPEVVHEIITCILRRAKRIFATLVLVEQESSLLEFINVERLDDTTLPLYPETTEIKGLNHHFFQAQWELLAPVFRRRSLPLKLRDDHVLPFLEDRKMSDAHGGYANAFRVTLHPGHQQFFSQDQTATVTVFRKELKPQDDDDDDDELVERLFQNEDRILELMDSLRNENVVQKLVAYKHKGIYNFLFPLSSMDLEMFITSEATSDRLSTSAAIINGLHGLASAINALHTFRSSSLDLSFKGCHHDLKPRNILVHEDKFLLADFGLSRFKEEVEDSASISKNIGEYLAPECRGPKRKRQPTGRKSDIWSFGCIIAETMAYMVGGSKQVTEFRESRTTTIDQWTNRSFHYEGYIKPSVTEHLVRLRDASPELDTSLLVELVNKMLHHDPDERPSAETVQLSLCCLSGKTYVETSLRIGERLADSFNDPYLIIECRRLRAWASAVGVVQLFEQWKFSSCQVALLSAHALEILRRIHSGLSARAGESECASSAPDAAMELEDLSADEPNGSEFDTGRLSLCINELVEPLPVSYNKSFKTHLFRSIAQDSSEEHLRAMKREADINPTSGEVGIAAYLKLVYSLVEAGPESSQLQHLFPKSATVVVTKPLGEYFSLGQYTPHAGADSVSVFIEWRPVKSPSQEISVELLYRVDGLAGALSICPKPAAMRVLDCIGFYLDRANRQFGLVFHCPSASACLAAPPGEPSSLFELIRSTPEPRNHEIALTYRFEIARALVSCILHCHSIGWLHGRISSHSVLFFHPLRALRKSRALPYLVGFNHSRKDQKQEFSHGPTSNPALSCYLHPDYSMINRFQKCYDYYSLGLVLLEVGLWRTMSSFRHDHPFDDQRELTYTILQKYLKEVRYRMGDIYAAAVQVCLDLSTEAWNTSHGDAEDRFQQLVVDSLDRCVL